MSEAKGNHHPKSLEEVERIKEDFAKVREDVGDMFEAAWELGKNAPGEVRDKFDAGMKQIRRMTKTAKARGSDMVEELQDKVSERPMTSVAISFGVGLLFGALCLRRR